MSSWALVLFHKICNIFLHGAWCCNKEHCFSLKNRGCLSKSIKGNSQIENLSESPQPICFMSIWCLGAHFKINFIKRAGLQI